jgi:hypothetical protein
MVAISVAITLSAPEPRAHALSTPCDGVWYDFVSVRRITGSGALDDEALRWRKHANLDVDALSLTLTDEIGGDSMAEQIDLE